MMETRTYRAPTLLQAMRLAHADMGTQAMVLRSTPVHVPHRSRPVAYDVVVTGEPQLPRERATTAEGTLALDPPTSRVIEPTHTACAAIQQEIKTLNTAASQWNETTRNSMRIGKQIGAIRSGLRVISGGDETPLPRIPPRLRLLTEPTETASGLPWEHNSPLTLALFGPPGAGRTTAALAIAQASQEAGKDTVVVTLDADDPRAFQELQARARGRRIELHGIQNTSELAALQALLGEVEVLIIDAPAHNPWSNAAVDAALGRFTRGHVLRYLVLNARETNPSPESLVARYAQQGIHGVVATRPEGSVGMNAVRAVVHGAGLTLLTARAVGPAKHDVARNAGQEMPTPHRPAP